MNALGGVTAVDALCSLRLVAALPPSEACPAAGSSPSVVPAAVAEESQDTIPRAATLR